LYNIIAIIKDVFCLSFLPLAKALQCNSKQNKCSENPTANTVEVHWPIFHLSFGSFLGTSIGAP